MEPEMGWADEARRSIREQEQVALRCGKRARSFWSLQGRRRVRARKRERGLADVLEVGCQPIEILCRPLRLTARADED